MFCKNCGKEIADGARFCASCGATVDSESKAAEATMGDVASDP
ncbi:MAG: zinc-ribbon domain-containing protein, partial [Clostridia bacterium]|nr:zinc-ribbon domain-containing protein [Clostridia bacterium]